MTNQEKYKQAFSVLRASDDFSLEVQNMEHTAKRFRLKKAAALAAACVMVVGGATAAYAADVGGIQRTVQVWFNGEMTTATVQLDGSGTYEVEYSDGKGEVHYEIGGGMAFTEDGAEIPVTDEDLIAEITAPEVEYNDDGTVWVCWFDQAVEITDKFEDGVCYVELVDNEDETLYMTIKYENGYATSPHKYVSPDEFNTTSPDRQP